MPKDWGDYRRIFSRPEGVESYDTVVYAEGTWDDWIWRGEQRYLAEVVGRNLSGRPIKYLDFACGPGRIISFVRPMVADATGIDTSRHAVERAAGKVPDATFVCGDASEDPTLLDGPYDLVTAFRFFLNAQESLRHAVADVLRDALAPNGLLVFNIHGNRYSARAPAVWFRRRVLREDVRAMSYAEVEAFVRQHGLEIVEWRGVGLLTRKLYAITPNGVRGRLERWTERTSAPQRACVDLIFVCRRAVGA